MALAIVPCDRNLDPCPKTALVDAITDHTTLLPLIEPDDLLALAAELAADDELGPIEALSQALALREELETFTAVWDSFAAQAGNPAAQPFATQPLVPLHSEQEPVALTE